MLNRPKQTNYAVTLVLEHHGTEEEQNQDIELIKEQLTVDLFEGVVETDRFLLIDMISVIEIAETRNDGSDIEDKLFS